MIFGSTIQALIGWARIALAAIVFGIAPMADASSCAKDGPAGIEMSISAEQTASDASTQDHSRQKSGDLSHCVHGHCHSPMGISNPVSIDVQWVSKAPLIASIDAGALLPRFATGLERPPKA